MLAQPGNPLPRGPRSLTQCPTDVQKAETLVAPLLALPAEVLQPPVLLRAENGPRRPGGGACVGRGHALRGHWRGFLPSWQLEGLTSRVWPWPEPDTAQDTSRPSRSGPRPLPRPQLPALGPQPGYATRRDVDLTRPRPQRPAQTARIDRRGRVLARGADIANPLPRADA